MILSVTAYYEGFDDEGGWQEFTTSALVRCPDGLSCGDVLAFMLDHFERTETRDATLTIHGEVSEEVWRLAEQNVLPQFTLTYERVPTCPECPSCGEQYWRINVNMTENVDLSPGEAIGDGPQESNRSIHCGECDEYPDDDVEDAVMEYLHYVKSS